MDPLEIAVVGGSIGGLTAACLLRDSGHQVRIHERSPTELEARGAGIGFLEMTSRYLVERAGLSLDEISIETSTIRYLDRSSAIVHESAHRYLFSSWNTVYRRLLSHWGDSPYLLGRNLVAAENRGDRVGLSFADGTADEADLLVAADGVGSTVRSLLAPHAKAQYAGYVAWRGTVAEADLPAELASQFTDAITYHVFANSHILVYPIPSLQGSVQPGERLVNFVWYRNYLDGADFEDLMTDRHGQQRELSLPPGTAADHHLSELRATAVARLPAALATLVELTEQPFVQVMYDIEADRMAFGRICLVGDAAAAVRPHAAAGSAKAAADGWALDAALNAHSGLEAALAAWESDQSALGRNLLERTRAIGRRSQVDNSWVPGDRDLIFGLYGPGN